MTFPAFQGEGLPLCLPEGWETRGFGLRFARDQDLPFLRSLYGGFREEELRPVPWPERMKAEFLDSQFDLQHRHFTTVFADSAFLIVEIQGRPIGRLYLHRGEDGFLIVDIGFVAAWRGRGLGGDLLKAIQLAATAAGQPVRLHVAQTNPNARRLYARHGFQVTESQGAHLAMRWTPGSAST